MPGYELDATLLEACSCEVLCSYIGVVPISLGRAGVVAYLSRDARWSRSN
jgi:hypothetical protein